MERATEWLRSRVAVDARALGAFRVALGLLLLADLAWRATDLVAHYTDAGALPRSALAEVYPAFAAASIHAVSGSVWYVAALFVLAGLVALGLLVGYRTRLATAISLVLLVSLQLRNPLVLNAGDSMLAWLLLWGLFLPLGARWSVDAVRRESADVPGRVATLATAALLLQVVLVYAVNAVLKLRGELWRSGEAIRYVFGVDQLTVLLGDVLVQYPAFLVAADRLWLGLIVASPLLLLLRGRARTAFASAFVAAHLGMALTLRLGLFPLISVAALLPFLYVGTWDAVESRLSAGTIEWCRRAARRFDGGLPRPRWPTVPSHWRDQFATGTVAVLLAIALVWNAASLGLVGLPAGVTSSVDPQEYRWDMFAPEPRTDDGWYVVAGTLASGERVDAFRDGALASDRPSKLASTFPSHRWFVYLLDLRAPANAPLRDDFARYVCRGWNADHDEHLATVSVTYVEERVRLDGPEERRRVDLGTYECAGA